MARTHHQHDDWSVFHVTTRTIDQEFHLAGDDEKRRLLQALDFYRRRGDFKLLAFVLMDNHVHMVISPAPPRALSAIVEAWKKWTSSHNLAKPLHAPLWEEGFDDNLIRTSRELTSIVQYIHNNPVRAGLVTDAADWPWSSVHSYLRNGRERIEVDWDYWQYA